MLRHHRLRVAMGIPFNAVAVLKKNIIKGQSIPWALYPLLSLNSCDKTFLRDHFCAIHVELAHYVT